MFELADDADTIQTTEQADDEAGYTAGDMHLNSTETSGSGGPNSLVAKTFGRSSIEGGRPRKPATPASQVSPRLHTDLGNAADDSDGEYSQETTIKDKILLYGGIAVTACSFFFVNWLWD